MMQKNIKIGPLVWKLWQCKFANTQKCHFEKSANSLFIALIEGLLVLNTYWWHLQTFCVFKKCIFWRRKDWRNWFCWKATIYSMRNWLYPNSYRVSIRLILGRKVTNVTAFQWYWFWEHFLAFYPLHKPTPFVQHFHLSPYNTIHIKQTNSLRE